MRGIAEVRANSRQEPIQRCSGLLAALSRSAPPRVLQCIFHSRLAEVLTCIALVMRSAAQPEILNRVFAARRPGLHMVELQTAT